MSALIKNTGADAAQDDIRSFTRPAARLAPVQAPRLPPISDAEYRALEIEVKALRQTLEQSIQDHALALEEASRTAHESALREANEKERERIATLRTEMTQAVGHWRKSLDDMELLALALAHTALDRLLSDPANKHDLVKGSIRRQVESLRRDSILKICVSPEDYSDDTLRHLASEFGKGLIFALDPELQTAACRIQLRLGQIELSLPQHRGALDKLWRSLSGETA
jgi:flagellar biosynthesis/type III secretory pathway protein FliH